MIFARAARRVFIILDHVFGNSENLKVISISYDP